MKVVTPEISWHGREPIFSIDLQPCSGNFQRIASCGVERVVRMWRLRISGEDKVDIDFLGSLNRHTATVNVCRFSPDGSYLATAGDDSMVLLWKLNDTPPPVNNIFSEEDAENKETWVVHKTFRGHLGDVYDLCWSPDSRYIVSGSVDNSAIAWDTHKEQKLALFSEHKNYVLGVAWDPLGEYIATLSSDRSCRIFSLSTKHCIHNISKLVPPHTAANTPPGSKPKASRIYHDDTLQTFFRRLTFSPDGQLLITPAGIMDTGEKQVSATFIFTRGSFKEPAVYLPSPHKASLVVRVCPCLFELRKVPKDSNSTGPVEGSAKEWEKYSTVFGLPYRVVFAVATEDSVLLYDSQQKVPFVYLTNIHYHTLSDLSWSKDGRVLVVSSTDGYCSVISFEEGELGVLYTPTPCHDPTPSTTTTTRNTNVTANDPKAVEKEQAVGDKPAQKKPQKPTSDPPQAPPPTLPPPTTSAAEKMEVDNSGGEPAFHQNSPSSNISGKPPPPPSQSPTVKPSAEESLVSRVGKVSLSPEAGGAAGTSTAAGAVAVVGEKRGESSAATTSSSPSPGEEVGPQTAEVSPGQSSSGPKKPKRIQLTTLSLKK